jgi:hypothetical protein
MAVRKEGKGTDEDLLDVLPLLVESSARLHQRRLNSRLHLRQGGGGLGHYSASVEYVGRRGGGRGFIDGVDLVG